MAKENAKAFVQAVLNDKGTPRKDSKYKARRSDSFRKRNGL